MARATTSANSTSAAAMPQWMVSSTRTAPRKSVTGGTMFQVRVRKMEVAAASVAAIRLPSEPARCSEK